MGSVNASASGGRDYCKEDHLELPGWLVCVQADPYVRPGPLCLESWLEDTTCTRRMVKARGDGAEDTMTSSQIMDTCTQGWSQEYRTGGYTGGSNGVGGGGCGCPGW